MSEQLQYVEALKAMTNGDESAKTKVAFYMLSGITEADTNAEEAVGLLEESVKEGDGDAMWMLGMCCEFGIGMDCLTLIAGSTYFY